MHQYTGKPLKIKGERVWRTYCGGRQLDALGGISSARDSQFPEEWMFSVVRANNVGREDFEEGLCYLDAPERVSLRALIESDPVGMLGKQHHAAHAGQMGVLIKMIDAAERLTVQVHPDKACAEKLFHSPFGKTECWHILGKRTGGEEPCLYIGFREGITREHWQDAFDRQDIPQMLAMLHRIPVQVGETYIIPGGVPHAIGEGCLLIEIQEPTDYTIRIERVTPAGFAIDERMCHQGIGFERMFDCFHYEGLTLEQALARWRIAPRLLSQDAGKKVWSLVDYDTTPCFRMERIEITAASELTGAGTFACFYTLSGHGTMTGGGETLSLAQNDQVFLPAACESVRLVPEGDAPLVLLRCQGPAVE